MELMVVGQPVPKSRPRVTYRKGRAWAYSEKPLVDYQDAVRALAFNKLQTDGGSIIPKGVPVRLRVSFILKGKQTSKPDLVNLASTIADALEGVWYDDDSQIAELQCRKRHGAHPRVMITVEQVSIEQEERSVKDADRRGIKRRQADETRQTALGHQGGEAGESPISASD